MISRLSVVALGMLFLMSLSGCPKTVPVPNLAGMPQASAQTAIANASLAVGTITQAYSATVPTGNVVEQHPAAGANAVAGSAVNLVVSKGPQTVSVPNVAGMTQAQAQSAITSAGLAVGGVSQAYSATVASGNVISVTPDVGSIVALGTAVSLVVSNGPSTVKAAFSADKTNGVTPLTVHFTDLSEALDGAVSHWEWNFGDGTSSAEQNPVHEYVNSGEYTATLRVTDTGGDDTATSPEPIVVDDGEKALIGGTGGGIDTELGGGIAVPSGALSGEILFGVADTGDAAIRSTLAPEVPYAGSLTVDAETSPAKAEVVEEVFSMTVTVPLAAALTPGTELDVYRKGDAPGQWVLLEIKATVDAGGQTASFETDQPGTYLVRENDEYSTPTIDLDVVFPPTKADLPPPSAPQLLKIAGSGPIPIVLIHGAGSYKAPGYARWDNFVTWAQQNLDLQNRYQLWWFLHDSDGHPVGFDINVSYNGKKNNAREFAEELQRQRDNGLFPQAEDTQFIIVAHSRGGLVARAFMENWPGGGDQVLAALTLATPHHGSPQAVPDWTYHTIKTNYSLPIPGPAGSFLNPGQDIMAALSRLFDWRKPGAADLAWDNFDALDPAVYGIPYREFTLSTLFAGVPQLHHVLSSADAGWSIGLSIDTDTHLPPGYARSEDSTLWDLGLNGVYDHKLLLYGGYAASQPLSGESLLENEGLFALSGLMTDYESLRQRTSHFAANDGMVPLQSALFLKASSLEPVYATTTSWWSGTHIKKPLEITDFGARLRVPANHVRYQEFEGYNHLDMVQGRKSNMWAVDDAVLFQYIKSDLDLCTVATPVAQIDNIDQNGANVTIDVSASHDRNNSLWPATPLEYRIDWGSGFSEWTSTRPEEHTYSENGTYTIILEVRDEDGMLSTTRHPGVVVEGITPGEDDLSVAMIGVPSGWFTVGRPTPSGAFIDTHDYPRHNVYLDAFQIGKYEVTNEQYAGVLNWAHQQGYLKNADTTPYTGGDVYAYGRRLLDIEPFDDSTSYCAIVYSSGAFVVPNRGGQSMASHPVLDVSWYGAAAFCNWLSLAKSLNPCYDTTTWAMLSPCPAGYRLPTSAEWERAAGWSGSSTWSYPCSADEYSLAWWTCNYNNSNPLGLSAPPLTSNVGYYSGYPSPTGCFDMAGNAREWCYDWLLSPYSSSDQTNPTGPASGSEKVARGGYWAITMPFVLKTTSRFGFEPAGSGYGTGFRVAGTGVPTLP